MLLPTRSLISHSRRSQEALLAKVIVPFPSTAMTASGHPCSSASVYPPVDLSTGCAFSMTPPFLAPSLQLLEKLLLRSTRRSIRHIVFVCQFFPVCVVRVHGGRVVALTFVMRRDRMPLTCGADQFAPYASLYFEWRWGLAAGRPIDE